MRRLPWVGLPTDSTVLGHHRFAVAGEVRACAGRGGRGDPVVLPSLQPPLPASDWLLGLDGLLLTGAVSNIEPQHYEGGRSWPGNPHDPARDANAFALLREALSLDLPVLAICRGFQELNVALGGSLHPQVHAVPGLADHREDPQAPVEVQYGAAHAVTLAADGWLAQWHGSDRVQVNSVHGQGIARLARACRSRPVPMTDWSKRRAACTMDSCSAYSGTRSGASCRRRSITLFSVHSAACRRHQQNRLDSR